MKVLIAGGAGYIGSVTVRLFVEAGHEVVVFDNLSNGLRSNIAPGVKLVVGDILNSSDINKALSLEQFDIVLNFAAKIKVGESFKYPKEHFKNNTYGLVNLVDAAIKKEIKNFIFSSTAAVYGNPKRTPIEENDLKEPTSPYGASKMMSEAVLKSYQLTHDLNWVAFRYFNVSGTYANIGPVDKKSTRLLPVAIDCLSKNTEFIINGGDYDTSDGTCVRDLVHVHDIARAHLLAAEKMLKTRLAKAINLGTGRGYSILEIVKCLEKNSKKQLKYHIGPRRLGDTVISVASNKLAQDLLLWKPTLGLKEIVQSTYDWSRSNKI